jgi:hypothetical protein
MFAVCGSRQQIADGHPRAVAPFENDDVSGFNFGLHRITAKRHPEVTGANRTA